MKKFFAVLMAVMLLVLSIPVSAVEPDDVNPIGQDISAVHAAYLTAGGNPSSTDFLTAEDFASHAVTVINVWSNGCGPCVNEMPFFQQAHEYFDQDDVLIVGCCSLWISGSYVGEWNWLQNHGYTYMNVIQDDVLYGLYSQNNFVPQTFIVNSEGIVVDFIAGGTTYNGLFEKIAYWLGQYTDICYDVNFVNGVNGEVFATQSVHIGDMPVYPEPPEVEGYNFSNWDPATPHIIFGPTTVTANYTIRNYRVRFYDSITGEKLKTQYVQYQQAATAPPAPAHPGYIFQGWDQDFSCVTEAMDVYTIYIEGEAGDGDVDGDGEITAADALIVLRAAMDLQELTPEQAAAADFNGDGNVDANDALLLLRHALDLA